MKNSNQDYMNMDDKVAETIQYAINRLKECLSADQLQIAKDSFIDIHEHKISATDSYNELSKKIGFIVALKIASAFYDIGLHIAVPPTPDGKTTLLREIYDIYEKEHPEVSLSGFQNDVIDYVYNQVKEL